MKPTSGLLERTARAGELSVVSLVLPGALFLIPLARFPGFVWLTAAGFKLPSPRTPGPGRRRGLKKNTPGVDPAPSRSTI